VYTHITGNSTVWDIVHTLYMLYHINIYATTLSRAHVYAVPETTILLDILCNTRMQVLNTRLKKFIPMNIIVT